jgi:hypothetical protein
LSRNDSGSDIISEGAKGYARVSRCTELCSDSQYRQRNPAEVERLATDLIELSTRHNFAHYLAMGAVLRGWARSVSGDAAEGVSWIGTE